MSRAALLDEPESAGEVEIPIVEAVLTLSLSADAAATRSADACADLRSNWVFLIMTSALKPSSRSWPA